MSRDDYLGASYSSYDRSGVSVIGWVQTCSYCKAQGGVSGPKNLAPEKIHDGFRKIGWQIPKSGKGACPKCITKFKAIKAKKKQEAPEVVSTKPREMQPADKRAIFRAVDENYDDNGQRYIGDATDHSIAEKLKVPRAWVTDVREADFGPSGANEEMDKVACAVGRIHDAAKKVEEDSLNLAARAEAVLADLAEVKQQIADIKDAVGPMRKTS